MAKLKKFPKEPKSKASVEVWKRYEAKCREVKKYNDAIQKKSAEKKRMIDQIRKIKSSAR